MAPRPRQRVNGEALRAWRSARHLTQKQLADAANISDTYVRFLESGRRPGNEQIATALAGALVVPVTALLVLDVAKDAA